MGKWEGTLLESTFSRVLIVSKSLVLAASSIFECRRPSGLSLMVIGSGVVLGPWPLIRPHKHVQWYLNILQEVCKGGLLLLLAV